MEQSSIVLYIGQCSLHAINSSLFSPSCTFGYQLVKNCACFFGVSLRGPLSSEQWTTHVIYQSSYCTKDEVKFIIKNQFVYKKQLTCNSIKLHATYLDDRLHGFQVPLVDKALERWTLSNKFYEIIVEQSFMLIRKTKVEGFCKKWNDWNSAHI